MPHSPPSLQARCRTRDDALAVVRRLREAGHVAYFAGGCVRDRCSGWSPRTTTSRPTPRRSGCASCSRNTQAVGAAFGVILVRHAPEPDRGGDVPARTAPTTTAAGPTACASPRPRRTPSGATSRSTGCSSIRSRNQRHRLRRRAGGPEEQGLARDRRPERAVRGGPPPAAPRDPVRGAVRLRRSSRDGEADRAARPAPGADQPRAHRRRAAADAHPADADSGVATDAKYGAGRGRLPVPPLPAPAAHPEVAGGRAYHLRELSRPAADPLWPGTGGSGGRAGGRRGFGTCPIGPTCRCGRW